jgi:beta-glucosidase-like glycosyl hydrolase
MDMASLTYTRNLAKLVADRKISESYLDEMVLPILEAKYDLGLFDYPYVDESRVDAVLSRPEGLALERKLAGRCGNSRDSSASNSSLETRRLSNLLSEKTNYSSGVRSRSSGL